MPSDKVQKERKPLIIFSEEIKTPPFGEDARIEAGFLLGCLQDGLNLSMPQARPMPSIGPHCLELRINDKNSTWRLFCRIDDDAILLVYILSKKTQTTPNSVIALCKQRLATYDSL